MTCGAKIEISSARTKAIKKGIASIVNSLILIRAMLHAMNIDIPTGGVINPIIKP